MTQALFFCLIVVARIADVSIGTVRTIMVIQGRRNVAFVLGFFEVLIWLAAVSGVINSISEQPLYAVAYALGFALGNYIGMTVENRLALGRQVVRIITRQGPEVAAGLREEGWRVTQFDGYGRDGPVQELCIQVGRREAQRMVARARALDQKCYYMIDDIRLASSATAQLNHPTGWLGILKRK